MNNLLKNFFFYLGIFVILGLCYISAYNLYQTDDYIIAYLVRKIGIIQNVKDCYFNWGGRYFSTLVSGCNTLPYTTNQILPKIYPIIYISFFILLIAKNLNFYFKHQGFELIKKTIVFSLIYFLSLSSLSENIFWFTASQVYFLPIILSLFLTYYIGKCYKTNVYIYKYLSFFFLILIIGCNEIIAMIWLGLSISILILKKDRFSIFFLIFAISCTTIIFIAPGNFQRLVPLEENLFMKIIRYSAFTVLNSIYIIVKITFLIPLILFYFSDELNYLKKHIDKRKFIYIFIIPSVILIFTGLLQLASERALDNLIFFTLLISSIYISFYFKTKSASLILFCLFIFITSPFELYPKRLIYFKINYNIQNIYKEIFFNDLEAYNQEMQTRHLLLKNTKAMNILLKPIKNKPSVLYFEEIGASTKRNYINNQLEKFYNKKNVALYE